MNVAIEHCSLYCQQSSLRGNTIVQLNYTIQVLSMKDEQSILVILHELDLQHDRQGFSHICYLAHVQAHSLRETTANNMKTP